MVYVKNGEYSLRGTMSKCLKSFSRSFFHSRGNCLQSCLLQTACNNEIQHCRDMPQQYLILLSIFFGSQGGK